MDGRPPTTVLAGFPGAGKTTLVDHLLADRHGRRLAEIVDDTGEIDIDARADRAWGGGLRRGEEQPVEMTRGRNGCRLREHRLGEVAGLAGAGRFDALVVGSTGIAQPMPLATTFAFRDEQGSSLADGARLGSIGTVVDAASPARDHAHADFPGGRRETAGPEDEWTPVDLSVVQIGFADTIVSDKVDAASPEALIDARTLVESLDPVAEPIETGHGVVAPERGIGSGRFAGLLAEDRPEVVRAKGFFWLASRPDFVGSLETAGAIRRTQAIGRWFGSVPRDAWTRDPPTLGRIRPLWHPRFGDRRRELVFIGPQLDRGRLRARLESCLLDAAEPAGGGRAWRAMRDPFRRRS